MTHKIITRGGPAFRLQEPRTVSQDPAIQSRYEQLLSEGTEPGMAEVLATRTFPGTKGTDRSFLEGHLTATAEDPLTRITYTRAHAAGISTAGKVYKSGLADKRGPADPAAWVGGVDDVKRVCRERNLACEGAVKHTPVDYDPVKTPQIRLAEDLVQEEMRNRIAEDPGQAHNKNLREEVIEKHGAPVRKD